MTRELLISAIKGTAEQLGYTFYSGADTLIAGAIKEFPTVWLFPLKIINVSGHKECRITYRVSLRFITLSGFAKINNESLWQIIESDALSMYHTLSEHQHVQDICNFQSTPSASYTTKNGDISINVEFDIETYYCI